jgi:putative PIN family toxin of toxin-antitoxin system
VSDTIPTVVFDCMIYLQGTTSSRGPAAALLRTFESGELTLLVSDDILDEVADVLSRPKVRRKSPSLTDERVNALLARIRDRATVVSGVPRLFSLERDPKDEKYLDLALHAGAQYLVTRDKDLLDLMEPATEEGRMFRQQHPGLTILDPVAFLRILAASPEGDESS